MEQARGTRIGRYEVLDTLGTGGMAVVYRARDPELNREVAVKVMGAARTSFSEEAVQRFQRELKAMALVAHPHVMRIFDGGDHEGRPFLVSELIEGRTLEQVVKEQGRLAIAEAVEWTGQLLEALGSVHAAGLVHRDIKPSNLMARTEGGLVLMDFGIALAAFNETLTRTGDVPGTLAYLPPECLAGQKATPASDLFQVGLVLYEMLVGAPLFSFKIPKEFLMAHGDLPPKDLFSKRSDASEALVHLLRRSLEPEPGARFQTAREMLGALRKDDVLAVRRVSRAAARRANAPVPAARLEPPPEARSRPALALGAGLLAAAVLGLGWWRGPLGALSAPQAFDAAVSADALEVTFESSWPRKGAVEVDLGEAGAFVAEEPSAARAGAFLAGAFLAGAFLAGAFLAGAFLAGAFLAGAFLAAAAVLFTDFSIPSPSFRPVFIHPIGVIESGFTGTAAGGRASNGGSGVPVTSKYILQCQWRQLSLRIR
ncbi:MAG: serine/threonine protein kinase [Candidatus Wallbacteria bacterium]|nr:serine/threonine protein kinase [Candidatus Wallbacteria bacterium]